MSNSKLSWYRKYFNRFLFQEEQLSAKEVNHKTELIVVIPCYNENSLIDTFKSLVNSKIPEGINIEILTVINHGENEHETIKQKNRETYLQAESFAKNNTNQAISFLNLKAFDLPKKHAGVGLARKIGMDEALHRFHRIEKDGIVICFDADALCEENYFETIYEHFHKEEKINGASIHFEHPLEGATYKEDIYEAITDYELHLRYYKNAIKYLNVPYAFHTIGSSMAVKCSAYAKQGGMNKRKAGEDFYFLSKIIQLGNFSEITHTKVIPSPRISDRVPFGTGRAVGDIINSEKREFKTYSFEAFKDLKLFFNQIEASRINENYEALPKSIQAFFEYKTYTSKLAEIKKNTKTLESYKQRFYFVFDAFFVLKFVHFYRDNVQGNKSLNEESKKLLVFFDVPFADSDSNKKLLSIYRKFDLGSY